MSSPERPGSAGPDTRVRGFAFGLAAYATWGLFPIYFKAVRAVPPLEILAHRVVWSMVFLAGLVTWQRRWREFAASLAPRRLVPYVASTTLVSANWLIFIWAVQTGRILESSLGYFVNPLVNVLLGALFLHERLTRVQLGAVALAAAGVLALALRLGSFPWVSLALAGTFGLYGLVRKAARIDAIVGLLLETALLSPLALGLLLVLAYRGAGAFGSSAGITALLASAGVITAVPLIWFAVGIRTLRLSTMGILQYVTPTGQFLCAVALYRERFTPAHGLAFALIWTSLALYTWEVLRARRAQQVPALD